MDDAGWNQREMVYFKMIGRKEENEMDFNEIKKAIKHKLNNLPMLSLTIRSRVLNETYDFWTGGGTDYVWATVDDGRAVQICHGGEFRGSTVTYGKESLDGFKNLCRNWVASRRRNHREVY